MLHSLYSSKQLEVFPFYLLSFSSSYDLVFIWILFLFINYISLHSYYLPLFSCSTYYWFTSRVGSVGSSVCSLLEGGVITGSRKSISSFNFVVTILPLYIFRLDSAYFILNFLGENFFGFYFCTFIDNETGLFLKGGSFSFCGF